MKLRVLGCSGGIGGRHLKTTSLLVDQDILIDAGTGVLDLNLDQLAAIDYVFLTHSHLDHIAALPLIVDAVADRRGEPLCVYATVEVIDVLRRHIFNWSVWPDFSLLPNKENPAIVFHPITVGTPVVLGGRTITALPANHSVPAVGYCLQSDRSSLVFSGDTGPCEAFWREVGKISNLRYLFVECAFPNSDEALALVSKHFSPGLLAPELRRVSPQCKVFVTHLKPGRDVQIMDELGCEVSELYPARLENGLEFEL